MKNGFCILFRTLHIFWDRKLNLATFEGRGSACHFLGKAQSFISAVVLEKFFMYKIWFHIFVRIFLIKIFAWMFFIILVDESFSWKMYFLYNKKKHLFIDPYTWKRLIIIIIIRLEKHYLCAFACTTIFQNIFLSKMVIVRRWEEKSSLSFYDLPWSIPINYLGFG